MELYGSYKSCLVWPKLSEVSQQIKWDRPHLHTVILNCDGALDREGEMRGLGGCYRDNEGRFICGFATFGPPELNVLDSKEAVVMLKGALEWWSNLGNVMEDIRRLMVDRGLVDVVFQPRAGNRAAHALAQFGLKKGLRFFWEDIAPFGWSMY
ncbi:unnamed protein product [Prunus armeniaca]